MPNLHEPDMNGTIKEKLLGNGWLAIISRVASPLCAIIMALASLYFAEMRGDLKDIKNAIGLINIEMGRHDVRLSNVELRNAEQDRRIEDNRNRIK